MPVPKGPVLPGVNGVAGAGVITPGEVFGLTGKLPGLLKGTVVEGTVVEGTVVRGPNAPGDRLGRVSAGLITPPLAGGPNRVGGEGIVEPAGGRGVMIVPGTVVPGTIVGWAGIAGITTPGCVG